MVCSGVLYAARKRLMVVGQRNVVTVTLEPCWKDAYAEK